MNYIKADLKRRLFKILSDTYKSKKIFLFGSYAYGTPYKDSDIDIAVIVKRSELPQYKRSRIGYSKIRGIGFPVELLVFTEDEVKKFRNVKTSLVSTILEKGFRLDE
ncbi:MAG: nucleotidyltransferase domain-containing protein [Actinobacteria bacterium]|nr:nucleotidyltransferase domain-containing protein [Actinomycetota bacterium]MCL5771415.1 nucleotidyltransferase domain-containing protein [Actinomycetota bacterium]